MKYGITWYVGDGEHDYEESGSDEYTTLKELLDGLYERVTGVFGEELLFDALDYGRQDSIHWITDDYGFAFYRST